MTLKEACKHAMTILKQVMEEKLNSSNVEVNFDFLKIEILKNEFLNNNFFPVINSFNQR
jgi:hypothetical protein